ncbi:MAG: hypothetical protein LBT47_09940, partial [Deltaproteobacteria bacterium]|nr:hypothetical protein [Deltaproteobacteria bacterium]
PGGTPRAGLAPLFTSQSSGPPIRQNRWAEKYDKSEKPQQWPIKAKKKLPSLREAFIIQA